MTDKSPRAEALRAMRERWFQECERETKAATKRPELKKSTKPKPAGRRKRPTS